MTTLQKTLFAATIFAAASIGAYIAGQAFRNSAGIQNPLQPQAAAALEDLIKYPFADYAEKLDQAEPALIVRPTQYPRGGPGYRAQSGKAVFQNAAIEDLIRFAYGFTPPRTVYPKGLPNVRFDYLSTIPNDQRAALREELKRQFGVVAHSETREMDVMVLKVNDPSKLANHLANDRSSGALETFRLSWGRPYGELSGFETPGPAELAEAVLQKPIIDRTGSTSLYALNESDNPSTQFKLMKPEEAVRLRINQLGLELLPGREKIETLVVERVNN